MREEYPKRYSHNLGRDMECAVFRADNPSDIDHSKVCLVFPPQNGRFYDFKNFNMVEAARPWIESGQMFMICVDGIDGETWSAYGDPRARIELQELWFQYVVDELLPEYADKGERAMTTGCSMGATHAANFFFRRPDLFDSVLGLSGLYDSSDGFGSYMDDLVYQNSPCDYLENMPWDHPYIQMYNERRIIICVGQGAWEDELKAGTARLRDVLTRKGIHAWIDFWGMDVNHDWPWWYKQTAYYLPFLMGEQ